MAGADVVVAGAGVIGLAVARELARRGASVVVLERGAPGAGAIHAAAGILSPTDPHEWDGALGRFNREAIERWPAWAAELRDETGEDPGLEQRGELRVGAHDDPFLASARAGARAAGWAWEDVDAGGLRELEPSLATAAAGVLLPGTATVHADRLIGALAAACARSGVTVRDGTEVVAVDERARCVRTATGEAVPFGHLVAATGAWTSGWAAQLVRPAIRPVLGEAVLVRAAGAPLCRLTVRTGQGSIVPRADGTCWIGTTVLDRGFQDGPSAGSVRSILARAAALLPAVDDALVVEARIGLRPVSADGLPVVGAVSDAVAAATGHGREGVIHAPACARAVAQGIVAGDWSGVPAAFSPSAQRERSAGRG
ncbi:MAG TPA: FAD-dependent oxidoreductase [Baekduia sp.]|nr:FAD-dependent oxidoreductase [Baekduia sp.]